MARLRLDFEGWFQCRLATNPDPTDEPRGVSGSTFALAGEPDLDRILRLQDPPPGTLRSHGPPVGVRVTRVRIDRREVRGHALAGAAVRLLDGACYHSRNGIVAEAGREPIEPFHLDLRGGGLRLSRRDFLEPARPRASVWDASPAAMERRGARRLEVRSETVMAATGIRDFLGFIRRRRDLLVAERKRNRDPVARTALDKRIRVLEGALRNPRCDAVEGLGARMIYRFEMNGPARVTPAAADRWGGRLLRDEPWPLALWTGAWDADALAVYMKGRLDVAMARTRG